jgi:hypothetical protein
LVPMACIKAHRRVIQRSYEPVRPEVLCPMALLHGCAWTETRYYPIMALEEPQLVTIMGLPGNHKTSVALYALMEHRTSPTIRLIERPTINARKFISSYVRIDSISSPSRYVKTVLEIKS